MTDRESVAAVLETTIAGESEAMYRVLSGDLPVDELQYDGWVSPMEATSGRICLRIDTPKRTRWVRWAADGQFRTVADPPTADGEQVVEPARLRHWLELCPVTPVLIEDTPFGRQQTVDADDGRRPEEVSR